MEMNLPLDELESRTEIPPDPPKDGHARTKRTRVQRSFPATTFEEALEIPLAIQKVAGGQRVRRLTLFDHLGKSPDSGPSRQLITNASKYGLIKGSYSSEYLELTPNGSIITSADINEKNRAQAKFDLAIASIKPFEELYQRNINNRLPATAVLQDFLKELGYSPDEVSECVETFILNAKYVGVLTTISGAQRIISIDHVLDSISETVDGDSAELHDKHESVADLSVGKSSTTLAASSNSVNTTADAWDDICFYITPIGSEGTEARNHSDLFLHSIVEPALEELKLKVIRADKIGKPGMINAHIIEHIIRSKIVIADLSFHNPNVFYELALRHACKLPTVHIIRKSDSIPFDIEQTRIIRIDDTSIYTLVPQLEVYKAEITSHVRRALNEPSSSENPITTFCPSLSVQF